MKATYPQQPHFADNLVAAGRDFPQLLNRLWITEPFCLHNNVSWVLAGVSPPLAPVLYSAPLWNRFSTGSLPIRRPVSL